MSCDWFCSSTDRQQVQLSVPQTVPDGSEGGDSDERYQLSEESWESEEESGESGEESEEDSGEESGEESEEESGTGQMFSTCALCDTCPGPINTQFDPLSSELK